ncbi:MAG: ATP-dependent DNA ligase [Actinomycetota bacterium]
MLLEEIARTSSAVAETGARLAKIAVLADTLRRMRPEELFVGVSYLSGVLPQGSIGVGWAAVRDLPEPAATPTLKVLEVHAALSRIAAASGAGSQGSRRRELAGLFGHATEPERRFLIGLLLGELRQGALAGIMVEAVARAADILPAEIRRALMVSGDLGAVAAGAIARGRDGLAAFRLTVLSPVQPMLAQSADDIDDAFARIRPASVEWKLDGARLQIHKLGSEVRAFTRNLADVTSRAPDVVEAVGSLPVDAVILDGEAIALRSDRRPYAFQVTMGRFGSRLGVENLRRTVPLSIFFFDCLHLDGEDLIDRPAAERWSAMAARVPDERLVNRIVADEVGPARDFMESALERGHEGVMVKALEAPYEAGRRGASWLKVKRAHTLDLVVLAAEWGHGRRRGWLSNLHLGARDPGGGGFVMLGKTFKGMTDQMLAWQTERLLQLETARDGITVLVRPELVVEVAFDGVQASSRYPGGLALRFARIKGYRHDKRPEDADTIDTVRALHARQSDAPDR